jgi:tagaturonate reductase
MEKLNRKITGLEQKLPIKIVQFGEGNFLRAFIDYAIQKLNNEADFNAGIAVVQPIEYGLIKMLNEQDGLYNLFMKGVVKGIEIQEKELISSIVKGIDPYSNFNDYIDLAKEEELAFVISNTTESGISYVATDSIEMQPPTSFPAKLTALLYKRYEHFNGDPSKGLAIIPCELINYNADTLKDIIVQYCDQWELENGFKNWLIESCSFHNTLVDRIVPGYPKDEIEDYNKQLPYQDNLIVTAETFFLWVIEGDEALKNKLPFHKTELDVKIVADMQPYRTRKVRILNGVHTAMVAFSIMSGNETVKESVDGDFSGDFINKGIFPEIMATIDMDKTELEQYADDVLDRFKNPFIKHLLSSIALNSIDKFKVRVLPSLLACIEASGKVPIHLTFAFACLIRFYKGSWHGKDLPVNDSEDIVAFFTTAWISNNHTQVVNTTLANMAFWNEDLTKFASLLTALVHALDEIETNGIQQGFANFCKQY